MDRSQLLGKDSNARDRTCHGRPRRRTDYRQHRTLLRNGQWRRVVEELSGLQDVEHPNSELETEIAYLRRHGEAGRLSYVSFRRAGLPCGSGAIESSIRRVINLRLKSNAMFWKSENAESMLQVRSQVVPDQWPNLDAPKPPTTGDGSPKR